MSDARMKLKQQQPQAGIFGRGPMGGFGMPVQKAKDFKGTLPVRNRYDFLNLNTVTFEWRLLKYAAPGALLFHRQLVSLGRLTGPDLAARTDGSLAAGTQTLILSWTIEPDGSVTAARMVGPTLLLQTSLPACVARSMRSWRFPASLQGAPVANFPFGPITIR